MCNKSPECWKETDNPAENQLQALYLMDTPLSVTNSTAGSNDDCPRVKLLCSFLGSIMPRPQDGKLRYVGGETRIVSLPRDISYEELMNKMRELYDGASVLKYQQPDEDLDALVSVVNNDDVTNMMEEYEKLGSGDGFTRLRIFLFPNLEQDGSLHYIDGDERDSEQRYVDALNNLNDGADSRRQQLDSPLISQLEDIHVLESFFDCSLHGHRSGEMSIPQYNLRHVAIPQIYNEADGPWSPAYYSPRHPGHLDPRIVSEFPNSPPSGRYCMQFGVYSEKGMDRVPEELTRSQLGHHLVYEHPPSSAENVIWMPAGTVAGDKAGFPGNLVHSPSVFEGNSGCEHCWVSLQRNQPNIGNGLQHAASQFSDNTPSWEASMLSADTKLHHTMYPKDQNDPCSVSSEALGQDRGWVMQPQMNPCTDDTRSHIFVAERFNDQYIVDSPAMNYPVGHVNLVDSHHVSSNFSQHQAGLDLGSEMFHDQAAVPHHLHISPPEERAVRYGNFSCVYGTENLHPMAQGHVQAQTAWRNVPNLMHGTASYEASAASPCMNGTVNAAFLRGTPEVNPRIGTVVDTHHPWVESSPKMVGFDGPSVVDFNHGQALKLNTNNYDPENRQIITLDPIRPPLPSEMRNLWATLIGPGHSVDLNTGNTGEVERMERNISSVLEKELNFVENVEDLHVSNIPCQEQNKIADSNDGATFVQTINSNVMKHAEETNDILREDERSSSAVLGDPKLSLKCLSFVPELIASIKKAALEEAEEVKAMAERTADPLENNSGPKEENAAESEVLNADEEPELDSDNDNTNKIEPTKAEAEAIERGLQTIKNDDLEEIRELGSGTYGAVYHGKWKGSDVAIKRIKASCFSGRPSERERLIADFWKEALILSSLHHPNVVSFYGIVRDGPDGSLATVTEFMVNGSLKQFLQKKDRTIDRRKRLIIAMDAAFGMEYLHGKNIVHFDLKCENLLVNMRDPQRPICKIGDLGLSKVKQHTLVSGGVRGTLPWMAPELLSGKSHMVTEKIDVYSFGIVMWELLTGEEPYAGMHCASIIGGIVNNTLRPQIPTWCDPEWKALMESCWSSEPAERPSFSEISRKLRSMAAAINVK